MKPDLSTEPLPPKAFIDITDIPKITHESLIRCGSYTTEWIARAVGLHPKPSNKVLSGPLWFDIFRPMFPRDMRTIFKFRGMESEEVDMRNLSNEDKLRWVKHEVVSRRWPPALLIKGKPVHWIAIGGYDDEKRVFYIYDSRFGLTSINPYLPIGNNVIGYDQLIKEWNGHFWLRYKAIVITKKMI